MTRLHSLLTGGLLILVTSLGTPFPTTAAEYSIQVLNALEGDIDSIAFALNNLGQVVGDSRMSRTGAVGASHPMFWSGGGPGVKVWQSDNPLFRLGGTGVDINDHGQIVGRAGSGDMIPLPGPGVSFCPAVVWDAANGLRYLETLGGACEARGINNAGQIAGSAEDADGIPRAIIWDDAQGIHDLGTLGGLYSFAFAINEAGQVVGYSSIEDGYERAFLWEPNTGVMRDLGVISEAFGEESRALALNNLGEVVGSVYGHGAVLWGVDGKPHLLSDATTTFGTAYAINDQRQVVGAGSAGGYSDAVIWDAVHGTRALESLLPPDTDWDLEIALDINNRGQIVGYGYFNGEVRGFLMTPVPEPSTLALAAIGGLALLAYAKCRRSN